MWPGRSERFDHHAVTDRGNIAGLVLAGGASRRMGGDNKALIALGDRPLIAHVIERLAPQVEYLAISANRDADRLGVFGLPILADRDPRLLGPLAGILAGMEWAADRGCLTIVTAAADTPFPPRDLVQRLAADSDASHSQIAIAVSGGRPHPVFALWPVSLRGALERHLAQSDDRSVVGFAGTHGMRRVEFAAEDGHDPFFNVNTPDELDQARRMLEDNVP